MRKIKFRAWIPEVCRIVEVWKIDFNLNEIVWGDDHEQIWRNNFDGHKKDCELMQSTGLLDKSGKEIYEGDIMVFPYYEPIKEVVSWDAKLAGYYPFSLNSKGYLEAGSMGSEDPDHGEVIGNIYEHPELLPSAPQPNQNV